MPTISTLELCAGAGGQALGLEGAGIEHAGLVEIDANCCFWQLGLAHFGSLIWPTPRNVEG